MNLNFLKNAWMNSVDFLAQAAHFLLTYSILVTMALLHWPLWAGFVGVQAYAIVKEWWYDTNFETPKQTWQANALDHAFLTLGAAAGWLVGWLL